MVEKLIKESSLEEFKVWMKTYQKNRYGSYYVDILDFFNENHEDIKEEQGKLNHIFTLLRFRKGERHLDVLRNACRKLHEYIVEQLLLRGWDPNASYNGNILYTPIRETIMSDHTFIEIENVELKQKKILLLLIQYGLSLDFMKTDSFGQSINRVIRMNETLYIYDWIDSLFDHFNEKQRKEWKTLRLQRLF